MTDRDEDRERREAAADEAAGWALRLDAPDATEADWLSLQAWLDAAPENREAYARTEGVLAELTASAPDLSNAYAARVAAAPSTAVTPQPRRSAGGRRMTVIRIPRVAIGAVAAAAAALVVVVVVRPPAPPVPAEAYQTAKGESRRIELADGSHIQLNSASRITVRLGRDARQVELSEGEAAFDVAKDATRPFLIAAGERTIRVVGTEFDVLRHNGRLRVTVRQGLVAVQRQDAPPSAQPVLLHPGEQFEKLAGEPVASVRRVDADSAFAWRQGELIYRDRPLSEVVEDLNRYFPTPVAVAGPAGDLRFSGVLKLDDEEQVLRRLQGIFHVQLERKPEGVTLRAGDKS